MADEDDEVVAKPKKTVKKNPLAAKSKATAAKVIEKAKATKPAAKTKDEPKAKAKPAKKDKEGTGRQPSEEMQEQRTALIALLKRKKNGLTSVEAAKELEWTSAQMAATSFGLVRQGVLEKEKDGESGRVTFKYVG